MVKSIRLITCDRIAFRQSDKKKKSERERIMIFERISS